MLVNILLVIAGIIALVLIAALLIKKEYTIAREITIRKPKQEVFSYIRLVRNQDNYNKWTMADPNAKKEYKGTDGTVGFTASWDSENKQVGKGEQQIVSVVEGERMDLALHFIKPFEGKASAHMVTTSLSETQTKVRWVMEGRNKYPFNLMNTFIGKMLGKDMETSLDALKNVLEKK